MSTIKPINLNYGEELILKCNAPGMVVKNTRLYEVPPGILTVNVKCTPPIHITSLSRPQTLKEAIWNFDLQAIPNIRHQQTGTDRFLPISHRPNPDGRKDKTTLNPERISTMRQRSADRQSVMDSWDHDQIKRYYTEVAEMSLHSGVTGRVQLAKKHNLGTEVKLLEKLHSLMRSRNRNKKQDREISELKAQIRNNLKNEHNYNGPEITNLGGDESKQGGKKKKKSRKKRKRKKKKTRKK